MHTRTLTIWAAVIAFAGALGFSTAASAQAGAPAGKPPAAKPATAKAIFAGGCFWCMEPPYDKLDGVLSTTAGYIGGKTRNPTYEQVSSGASGHTEVVQVEYDPKKISYEKLLEVFWVNIDPTVRNRQFCDVGTQYRTGIFTTDDEQRRLAEASKAKLEATKPFKQPIVTEITAAAEFWPAEDYHQDYYKKNPVRYKFYRSGCGRDERLKELWGKAPE
ncbi:MAG: peptide-methionine (S)-S-oxide reductase MsrA [Burkholderiales bacterium]